MACWGQLEFPDPISSVMRDFIYFHDHVMLILIFTISYVGYIMCSAFYLKLINVNLAEHQNLEVMWTLFPVFILLYIGAPSLYILYRIDYEFINPGQKPRTVKIVGHQWYWEYNFGDLLNGYDNIYLHSVECYITPTNEISSGRPRLLSTDNIIQLPAETELKLVVTSADVLHSWTLPGLGIKMDACPGRLNSAMIYIHHPGRYYGQCSEICGANHRFMPISVKVRPLAQSIEGLNLLRLYKIGHKI